MAKRNRNNKNAKNALAVVDGKLEQLAHEGKLSEGDIAILSEVALNRKAIVKLGAIALDHERRIGNLEDALADLAGEEPEPVDVEGETVKDDEDEG